MHNTIHIEPLAARHIVEVAALLASHLQMMGYPFDRSPDQFHARVTRSLHDLGGVLVLKARRWEHWVAVTGGRVAAAICVYGTDPVHPEPAPEHALDGQIVWLLFAPQHENAADALLVRAAEWLRKDWTHAQAFDLANCLGWCGGVADAWTHIAQILARHGFNPDKPSELMWGRPYHPDALVLHTVDPTVEVNWRRDGTDLCFEAFAGTERVGELSLSRTSATSWVPAAHDAWWIDDVEVVALHRGRGVGKRLFRSAAQALADDGDCRVIGYTAHPAAAALNRWFGIDQSHRFHTYKR